MKRAAKLLFVIGTVLSFAALGLVLSGSLDSLSNDGAADSSVAIQSIILYWLVGACLCWSLSVYRTHRKQFVLLSGSLLICLGVLEIGLRFLRPNLALREFGFLRSSTQHHVLMSNTEYDLGRFEGRNLTVRTNEDRLRTSYDRATFLGHKQRVVCLGDSFTFGAWVDASESYPEQLEALLRSEGITELAVLNAGMLSYSPVLHEQLLKQTLLKYNPTVVSLMLDCTDIGDDYHYAQGLRNANGSVQFSGPKLTVPHPHLGATWRLVKPLHPAMLAPFKLLRRAASNYVPHDPLDYYKFEIPVNGVTEKDRFFIYRYPLSVTTPFFEESYTYIERIARTCARNDAKFVLIIAPRYHHWSNRESPDNWEAKSYGDDLRFQYEIFEFFQSKEETSEFRIVSLLPAFKKTTEFPLVFRSDPHWNTKGNRFVAEQLRDMLLNMRFVDAPKTD